MPHLCLNVSHIYSVGLAFLLCLPVNLHHTYYKQKIQYDVIGCFFTSKMFQRNVLLCIINLQYSNNILCMKTCSLILTYPHFQYNVYNIIM